MRHLIFTFTRTVARSEEATLPANTVCSKSASVILHGLYKTTIDTA